MAYSKMLRELFPDISLEPDDLLVLETFQIKYLPDRVLHMEFSTLLRAHPYIQKFLIAKYPPIQSFFEQILEENVATSNVELIHDHCDKALWEIADLIAYNKYPSLYDTNVDFPWELNEIINARSLEGKVVADVGAGSGMLAFMLSISAQTVYAIEPAGSFRDFIREKAILESRNNIYAIDGFLDLIPLPDNSLDVLMTSNAIGWNLEQELHEIERVLKPGGIAIHLMRTMGKDAENPIHDIIVSDPWNYKCSSYDYEPGLRFKYTKILNK